MNVRGWVHDIREAVRSLLAAGVGAIVATSGTFSGTVSAALLAGQASLSHTVWTGGMAWSTATPAALTVNTNDYNPGVTAIQRWSSTGAVDVTGIVAESAGRVKWVANVGANAITLKHASASSAAANRFTNSTGADIVLAANGGAIMFYDGTSATWRVWPL